LIVLKSSTSKKPEAKPTSESINWYDHPEWYEAGFLKETPSEARFLEDVFRKYVPFPVERILEAGCGSGRLVREMARRGYAITGMDLNQPALDYCEKSLKKLGCRAVLSKQDMTSFHFDQPFDAAFNAINTFRHLETESAAVSHIKCIAKHLRPGGVFVLSLHIVPNDGELWGTESWSVRTPEYNIKYSLSVQSVDLEKRLETLKMTMKVSVGDDVKKLTDLLRLRLYDVEQLKELLAKIKSLELVGVYDFWFDISDPCRLSKKSCDVVLVLKKKA
jgi:2-polyprenyl-3-methyl-5-hydroxy-6-metoxy-1,4-benzoquinol methylase